jgi:tetratricopeptide (TPR) repeat protein
MATAAMQLAAAYRRGTPTPTTAAGARRREIPATPRAFELFLRGMEHARTLTGMLDARKCLQDAVEEDPQFAPAWAALGRCHRVYGKYYEPHTRSHEERADEAFRRALDLSPQLPLAHRYLTHFEAEQGRAEAAIARLLSHARTNRNDAQLFAGLVHACRYAGLMDASLAAHEEARRLDPNVPTSVEYTWGHFVVRPDDTAAIAAKFDPSSHNALFGIGTLGSLEMAAASVRSVDLKAVPPAFRVSVEATIAAATEPPAQAREKVERAIAAHSDPEALFLFGVVLLRIGDVERGLGLIGDMVGAGYTPADTLRRNWVFDAVRGNTAFTAILERASVAMASARAVFEREGGPALLGLATAASSPSA